MKKLLLICLLISAGFCLSCGPGTEFIEDASGDSTPSAFSTGSCVIDMVYSDGAIWAGTSGVYRCDLSNGTITRYSGSNGPGSKSNRKITVDSNGNIWCTCYTSGVSRFDGTNWQHFTVDDGLVSDDTITIASDSNGGTWVSAYWGVSYFDGNEWQAFVDMPYDSPVTGGETPNNPDAVLIEDIKISAADVIFIDSQNRVWFTCRGSSITMYADEEWSYFDGNETDVSFSTAVTEGDKDIVWFGSNRGITRYDGTGFSMIATDCWESIIPRPYIQDILEDNKGNIWMSAYGGGVVVYDGSKWTAYSVEDGLPDINCNSLFMDKEGNVGVLSGDGVALFDGTAWKVLTEADGIPEGAIRATVTDDDGNIWFGSDKGIISKLLQ